MNLRLILATALIALVTSGCGQKDASTTSAGSGGTAAAAAPSTPAGPRTVEITAGDNMKFNLGTIEAKPGEEIKLVLTNIGTQPKEVMGHNWVLIKADADVASFAAAAAAAKASDYIPTGLKDQIIAHTALIGPRKSDEITFKAPEKAGDYPYLCTFPAHYQVGMKGVLSVK